jgi:SpoVK/Ycf46/Vps4 family AAA+-type ATPase
MADDADLLKLAARTPGFASADLANLVNEAALLAAWLQTGEIAILVPFAKRLPAHRGSANDPRMVEIEQSFNPQHLQENSH